MSLRPPTTIDLGRAYRGRVVAIGALTRPLTDLVAKRFRREQQNNDEHRPATHDIVKCCEAISAQAFDFVLDEQRGPEAAPWHRVHAIAIGLDRDIADVAASTSNEQHRRLLDELAAAAIALRGALEVRIRATRDDDPSPAIVAASNDLVVVRCEDLVMTARNVESRHA